MAGRPTGPPGKCQAARRPILPLTLIMRPCQWRRNEFGKGDGTPVRREYGGPIRRQTPENILGAVPLFFFGSKSTINRFDKRFRGGQYSLVSFLFAVLLLTVPPRVQPFVKVGGTCPPCPMESAPLGLAPPSRDFVG